MKSCKSLFSCRHLAFYFRTWPGLSFEDRRYLNSKMKYQDKIWIHWTLSFSLYHMLNTVIFFGGLVPLYYLLETQKVEYLWLLIVGFILAWACIVVEVIGFWFALYLMALSCNLDLWWTILGPIALFVLLYSTSQNYVKLKLLSRR